MFVKFGERMVTNLFGDNFFLSCSEPNPFSYFKKEDLRDKGWRVICLWENEIKLMEIADLEKLI